MSKFKLFSRIITISALLALTFGGLNFQVPRAKAVGLTACGTISAAGTYVLQNDVTTDGTCFIINASGVTLDLNGHTITYDNLPAVTVPNSGFENGSGSSITNWDLSHAPSASQISSRPTAYTSVMKDTLQTNTLKFSNPASEQYILSDPISVVANKNYTVAAIYRPTQTRINYYLGIEGSTCTQSNVDTVMWDNTTCAFTPTISSVRLKIGIPGATSDIYFDGVEVRSSKYYAVYANNRSNIHLTNGSIIEGTGGGYYADAVRLIEVKDAEVDHLNIKGREVRGLNAIYLKLGSGWKVHDNTIDLTARRPAWFSHYGGASSYAVYFDQTTGNSDIFNNNVVNAFRGIGFQNTGTVTNVNAYNNSIHTTSYSMVHAYAIEVYSWGGDFTNWKVYNNYINNSVGSGIFMDTNEGNPTLHHGEVYNNYVEVRHGCSEEYMCPGYAKGIWARFGVYDVNVYHNVIKVYGGTTPEIPGDTSNGIGLRLSGFAGPGASGSNLKAWDNISMAYSNTTSQYAAPVVSDYENTSASPLKTYERNTFISNSHLFHVGTGLGGIGKNTLFTDNTFIKAPEVMSNFHTFGFSNTGGGGHNLVDSAFLAGAQANDMTGSVSIGLNVKNTLNLKILDGTKPKSGLAVTAASARETQSATTDANGLAKLTLTRYAFTSSTPVSYTPHTITFSGYPSKTITNFNMDARKEMTINLSGANPPIISNVAVVPDLSDPNNKKATITWETDQPTAATLEYGTSTSYGGSKTTASGTSHSITLDHLSNATYHFRVKAWENAGLDHQFDIFTAGLAGGTSGVTLTKSVDKTTAKSGDILTYTINYTFTGQSASNAKIEDPLPAGTSFVSAENGGQSDGTKVIWTFPNISANIPGAVSFKIKIN